jgi:protein-S-isoprenylcysteine O-methyltransferase Ste14
MEVRTMTSSLSGLLLGAWLLLEIVLRNGAEARSWRADDADRSSTRLIVATYVVAFVGPFLLDASGFGAITTNSPVAWAGVAVGALGLVVRIWSMQVLGSDYTRSLRTHREQTIIDRGPYRAIRHPGYLGSILVWTGSRLAVNWLIALITAAALIVVYCYRISAEEHMLEEHFGEAYLSYETRTWRLVPLLW